MKIFIALFFLFNMISSWGKLIHEKEIPIKEVVGTPQVPRLSKDSKYLVFEVANKDKTELWLTDMNKKVSRPLTSELQKSGRLPNVVENASWHPLLDVLVFEGRKVSKETDASQIFIARVKTDGNLGEIKSLVYGRRPQFSTPFGRVLFLESSSSEAQNVSSQQKLSYFIVGKDPFNPSHQIPSPLRGPIEKSSSVSFSHPSLSQDGSTIYFASEKVITRKCSGCDAFGIEIDSVARQQVIGKWDAFKAKNYSIGDMHMALIKIAPELGEVSSPLSLKNFGDTQDILQSMREKIQKGAKNTPSGLSNLTQYDLIVFWTLGLLEKTHLTKEEVQDLLASRIWQTNIFGGEIKQTVLSGAPLPQKYPTPSPDSEYVFFEAGHFRDRHIYVVEVKSGKAIKLTTAGTYNSSPEVSADGKSIVYETNRTGKKSLFMSQIDWGAVKKQLK
jgi:hypothetical protein